MSYTPLDILIEVSPGETRAALVDGAGQLCRLRLARVSRTSLVGGSYLGRVVRVEKGMAAAFVDIGLSAPAFLGRARSLHEGEALVVQVVRDAWNSKSANVIPAMSSSFANLDIADLLAFAGFAQADDPDAILARLRVDNDIQAEVDETGRYPSLLIMIIVALDYGSAPVECSHGVEVDAVLGDIRASLGFVPFICQSRHCQSNVTTIRFTALPSPR